MKALLGRGEPKVVTPRQPRPRRNPFARLAGGIRGDVERRSAVVLPQYARPGHRYVAFAVVVVIALFCFVQGFAFALVAPSIMVPFGFPLLLLLGLAVWALPELGAAPTRALETLFFAFFLSLPLWPNYLAIALPGLPWITVLRLVGFPLVLILLLCVSISREFRGELARILNAIPPLWKFLSAFAILQVLSVVMSNAPSRSINKLLAVQVNWTAMFFISVWVFSKPKRVERWALLLCAAAVVLSIVGAIEYANRHILWAGHIPQFLAVEDESVQRVLNGRTRAGTMRYRVKGTYSTALGFGEFLALTTPFFLHFVLGSYRLLTRIVAGAAIPLILYAIILTDTRLSFVGFLMSCVFYLFFWGALKWRQNPKSIIGPAVVLSYPAVFCAFVGAILVIPRLRLMTLGGGQHQASTEARGDQVAQGLPLIFKNPFGYGIGRGAAVLGFRNPAGTVTIDTYWLLTALEYGVLGFILFYGMFVVAGWAAFQGVVKGTKDREQTMLIPLAICLAVYVVIKAIYAGVENQALVYMMLGAVVALCFRRNLADPAPAKVRTPLRGRRRPR